jgi:hypothetical protein
MILDDPWLHYLFRWPCASKLNATRSHLLCEFLQLIVHDNHHKFTIWYYLCFYVFTFLSPHLRTERYNVLSHPLVSPHLHTPTTLSHGPTQEPFYNCQQSKLILEEPPLVSEYSGTSPPRNTSYHMAALRICRLTSIIVLLPQKTLEFLPGGRRIGLTLTSTNEQEIVTNASLCYFSL